MDEQKHATETPGPAPVPDLMLVDREGLRVSLRPGMNKATFANWLFRAQRDHAFPKPIRMSARSVAWSLVEVRAWLASRPRKGVFTGRRREALA